MTDVREVDLADEALLRQLWEAGWEAEAPGRPWHSYRAWQSKRQEWIVPKKAGRVFLRAAYDDRGEPVGYSQVEVPDLDNPHLAFLEVFVHPDHQRQGHASALLDAALRIAREDGRTTVVGETSSPIDRQSAGELFAMRHGFAHAQEDEMKVADLAATAPSWPGLLAGTEASAAGYRFVTWRESCPEEYVAAWCEVFSAFLALIPLGELDMEPQVWDEARLREKEERHHARGGHEVTTLVLAPDGSAAGYTELLVTDYRPDVCFQGGTAVLPGHRGHRLGLRLKLLNQVAFREAFPECTTVLTGNASANEHMNAVNDRLGFRVVERCVEMQRKL